MQNKKKLYHYKSLKLELILSAHHFWIELGSFPVHFFWLIINYFCEIILIWIS